MARLPQVHLGAIARALLLFFRTEAGSEPVRARLRDEVSAGARKTIGADIKTVQATWRVGKPLVDGFGQGLWEVSTHLKVEYRTLFAIDGSTMVLLHGFEKRSRKTPKADLDLARQRKATMEKAR